MTQVYTGVIKNYDKLISAIEELSEGFPLSEFSPDLAALLLALYEMYYMDDIPLSVSIAEAVELVKYSTDKSNQYVNGVCRPYIKIERRRKTVKLIDGKAVSQKIKEDLKLRIDQIKAKEKSRLAVVLVGENPASRFYVANKIKDCEQVGIKSIHCHLQEHTEKAELIKTIEKLNNDKELTALLCNCLCPSILMKTRFYRIFPYIKTWTG